IAVVHGAYAATAAYCSGDLDRAEHELRRGFDILERLGYKGYQSTIAGMLAAVLIDLGREEEAEEFVAICRELTVPEDVWAQVQRRDGRARLLARGEKYAEAERLAREAVAWSERSDVPDHQGDALRDLAEVLAMAGKRPEAIDALNQALQLYLARGSVPMAAQVKQRLAVLGERDTPESIGRLT
ncbi:MAG: tetratricopeptide repeat protein, partial [Chloroflexota bacterium]